MLSRQVGYSKALEIAISGQKVGGEECQTLGLANRLVEDDKIMEEAMAWAKALSARPTLAIGIAKADMFYSMSNNLKDTIAFEANQQMAAFESHDFKEGVAAFIQKRKPNFLGK